MEFSATATETEQRGCHGLPGSDPGRRRGRTHSSRASPGVRLRSWLARPRPGLRAGRGFPQAPSPPAGPPGTCPTNLVSGGAKERLSGRERRGSRGSPFAEDAWNAGSSPGRPAWDAPWPTKGRRYAAGAGSAWREALGGQGLGGRKQGGREGAARGPGPVRVLPWQPSFLSSHQKWPLGILPRSF